MTASGTGGKGRLPAAVRRWPAPVLGVLGATVQGSVIVGVEVIRDDVDWLEVLFRTVCWSLVWTGVVWWTRRRSGRPGVRDADLAVRRGSWSPGTDPGDLRTGLLSVRREMTLARGFVVGLLTTVGVAFGFLTALTDLGGVGWVTVLACGGLAVGCAGSAAVRLRRVDRLLAELPTAPPRETQG